MTTSYHDLNLDALLEVRLQYRSNLAAKELQAAKFGDMHIPTPLANELIDIHHSLTAIDAELHRRAVGAAKEPPELLDIRQKIGVFESALAEATQNHDQLLQVLYAERLAELHEQEAGYIRQRDDYSGAVHDQAQTVASDLTRGIRAYHAALVQHHDQPGQFINKRSLKLDLTMFRDRVQERSQLLKLLASPTVRVVQIVGPSGMGKTALTSYAMLTLEQQGFVPKPGTVAFRGLIFRSAHTEGGLTFESLVRDLAEVCPEVAEELGALGHSGDYVAQAAVLFKLLGDQPLLIVLDNCEAVMDDAGTVTEPGLAALLIELLRPNHAWRVVLTSRRELAVPLDGQRYLHQMTLREGLPVKDAMTFLHDLDPGATTPIRRASKAVVTTMIERLHGRPRLLEQLMALLKTSTYTPEQLVSQPDLLDGLTQTLHGWLTVGERAILRALAVFGVPASSEAVGYLLLSDFPALDVDSILVRLSRNGIISQNEGLFSLHPLDAATALHGPHSKHLSSGLPILFIGKGGTAPIDVTPPSLLPEYRALHLRAAHYYVQRELPQDQWRTLEDLSPQIASIEHLTTAGQYDAAANVLGTIDGDYLMVWGHAARVIRLREPLSGKLAQPTLQVQHENNLGLCYAALGRFHSAITCYERGLKYARQYNDKGAEGALLGNLGNAYRLFGDVRLAINHHEQWLTITREIGHRRGEGMALGNLGNDYYSLGEMICAIDLYEQWLMIAREIGHRHGEGNALGGLANANLLLGDVRRAINFYEQSLVIEREIGARRDEGTMLGNLGSAYLLLGDVRLAINHHEQWLMISREIGDRDGEGKALGSLGNAYAALGEVHHAIDLHNQHLALAREIGNRGGEGNALWNLGNRYAALGEVRQAISIYEQALVISREIGDRQGEGAALGSLGTACVDVGDVHRAIDLYEQQLVIVREIGDRHGEDTALGNLGNRYAALGEVHRAIDLYEQQLVIVREISDRRGEGTVLVNLGSSYMEAEEVHRAIDLYEQSLVISREIGNHQSEGTALGNLGSAYHRLGDVHRAIDLYEQSLIILREIGDRSSEGVFLGNLGSIYYRLGEIRRSIDLYEQQLAVLHEIGDRRGQATALGNLGNRYAALGEVHRAIDLYEQQLVIARELGDRQGEGTVLGRLGNRYTALGEVCRAIDLYEHQLVIARELGDRRGEGAALGNLGLSYARLGEVRRAIDLHEQALVISRAIGDRQGEAIYLLNTATAYRWLGDTGKAHELLTTASTIGQVLENPHLTSNILIEQGHCFRAENAVSRAADFYTAALALDFPHTAGRAAWSCGLVAVVQGSPAQAQVYWEDVAQRCTTMIQDVEYRYLAAAVTLAMSCITGDDEQVEVGLTDLRTILGEAPIPMNAAEILRDLRDVAQALGKTPALVEPMVLLEPIAAQMQVA
jgi:tetratricopeptide (TPR) repeat protein